MMERIFDCFLSGIALILLLPLFFPISIILSLTGERKIFFTQERIGKNGESFRLIKFATMLENSSDLGSGSITVKDDFRILPVGKFLRKTKINELPQLINIFLGDMSIIGPRPLTPVNFSYYPLSSKLKISQVRPGLSGIGSIVFRGEEEIMSDVSTSVNFYKTVITPYKGSLEEWFVLNKSIYLYFSAIALTVWVVLFPKTNIVWKSFKNLPRPPSELIDVLNYK